MSQRMLALTLLAAICGPAAASLSAVSQARLFLRSHAAKAPQGDELAELNKENPEAYALVKALLTKRSLGLLNSRHPTASFGPEQQQQPEEERGPEAFAKFASPGELQASHQESLVSSSSSVALPYANVAAAPHDWMNWKPQDSGASDEQMVQNVLGAVASLKSGKRSGLLSKQRSSENTLSADESSFGVEAEPVAAPVAQPVLSAPPAPQENSYLKNVDFGLGAPEAMPVAKPAQAQAKPENSYLDGLDLSGDMPEAVASAVEPKKTSQIEQGNALSSFSWDDSAPKAPKAQVMEQIKDNGKDHALLGWLGVVNKAPEPQATAPAPPSNPYLTDLS